MKAFTFLRDPMFLVGAPVLILALIYDQPVLMGLGMSLVACTLLAS
ncbi:hypothetical protein [Pseudomonas sp. LP_7_YM]|nr:hypothetical protein [Pseudomonas sp. LP_7_YM]